MVKSNLFVIVIVVFFISCTQKRNDIYEIIPKESPLDIDFLRSSEMVFKLENGWTVLYDLDKSLKNGEYNPHLLFYDEENHLTSASYFLSEDIINYEDNTIYAYINDYRKQRKSAYRNDIPNNIEIKYFNYKSERPKITSRKLGVIDSLIYNSKDYSVSFIMENDSLSHMYKKIPLYKIHFNYWMNNLSIREVDKDSWIIVNYFFISKEQIDYFYKETVLGGNIKTKNN